MRKNNYLESKYQLGADQLAIYEVEPGTTEGKSMEYLGKGHDSRTEALSSLTSSPFSLYLPLMQYAFFFL